MAYRRRRYGRRKRTSYKRYHYVYPNYSGFTKPRPSQKYAYSWTDLAIPTVAGAAWAYLTNRYINRYTSPIPSLPRPSAPPLSPFRYVVPPSAPPISPLRRHSARLQQVGNMIHRAVTRRAARDEL